MEGKFTIEFKICNLCIENNSDCIESCIDDQENSLVVFFRSAAT